MVLKVPLNVSELTTSKAFDCHFFMPTMLCLSEDHTLKRSIFIICELHFGCCVCQLLLICAIYCFCTHIWRLDLCRLFIRRDKWVCYLPLYVVLCWMVGCLSAWWNNLATFVLHLLTSKMLNSVILLMYEILRRCEQFFN